MSETKHSPAMELLMKQPYIWNASPASQSAPAPSDPAGPLPVVGSGGGVGLRVESANALATKWEQRAARADENAAHNADPETGERDPYWSAAAGANRLCAAELRRQMEAETVRQPEPNRPGAEAPKDK